MVSYFGTAHVIQNWFLPLSCLSEWSWIPLAALSMFPAIPRLEHMLTMDFREEEKKEQASPSRCYNYSIKVRRSHGARFVTSFAPSMTELAGDR